MKMISIFSALFAVAVFTQGCVSAGTHQKLQNEFDKTTADLAECKRVYANDEANIEKDEHKLYDQGLIAKDLESKLGKTSSAKAKLESNVTEMKAALEALTKQRLEAEKRMREFRDLVSKFKNLTDTGKLTVKIVDGQMVVSLSSDVLFSSGSAHLSKNGAEAVQQVTSLLESVPDRKFQIEGFTDNLPIHTQSFPSNWELASARALSVVRTMLDSGMPPERVSAASFADTHPVKSNETEDGRSANRRIEIVVVPDLSALPGYGQLQSYSNP